MIQITDKSKCCGCNACGDVCTHKAITFKTDIEGFWYPEVDKNKCTDCGLCEKVCPNLHSEELKKNDFEIPVCYAAIHKNIEVRFDSTSGGAFTALAEYVYKQGGYVGGAVYNEDWSVSQFLSADKTDLPRLRSSKYLQSRFDGFYIAVREALKTGKPVFVCGGPCQMAALRGFLHKTYDNLILVDYICRGIASPLLFRKYIEYLENKHHSKVVYFKAKNKELGWRKHTFKILFENRDVEYQTLENNPWRILNYVVPEVCRPSCFECPFKGFPRATDITIGDLWADKKYIPKELDNDLGTSVVFVHSKKGADLIQNIKMLKKQDFPLDKAIAGNYHLMKPLCHSSHDRDAFYAILNESLDACIKKYLPHFGKKGVSVKEKLKNVARFLFSVKKASGWSLGTWEKNFRYNFFCGQVKGNVLEGKFFIINKYCTIVLESKAQLILNAPFYFGSKRVKGSRLDSRLLIENGGRMEIKYEPYSVAYGADIEVFRNATLEIGGGLGANIGLTIICADNISIGRHTGCGRNVTIRDNNGEHFISIRGYKISSPVTIKEHVWLTESCTVMPGAVIEPGAIISARSVVSGHIPAFSIVKGDPAVVVEKNILWKA